jgi:hypothetical protein
VENQLRMAAARRRGCSRIAIARSADPATLQRSCLCCRHMRGSGAGRLTLLR